MLYQKYISLKGAKQTDLIVLFFNVTKTVGLCQAFISAHLLTCYAEFSQMIPFLFFFPFPPISVKPMWREWWTWSLFASVSHQLQSHCVLHLSTPYEAFNQQTVLLWWGRPHSSFVMSYVFGEEMWTILCKPCEVLAGVTLSVLDMHCFMCEFYQFWLTLAFTSGCYILTAIWIRQKGQQKCIFSKVVDFLIISPALKRFLLYVRRSEIRGVDIDNPYMNVMTALTVPDIDDVTMVDYDAEEERIYWADIKTQTIKRAFINGTQLETIISSGGCISDIHPVYTPSSFGTHLSVYMCKLSVYVYWFSRDSFFCAHEVINWIEIIASRSKVHTNLCP